MKKISVCKNQQIIFGHVVPTGAVYGKFTYVYDRRVITGYTYVYDKNNRKIFNKNGTPKMRAIIKEIVLKGVRTEFILALTVGGGIPQADIVNCL